MARKLKKGRVTLLIAEPSDYLLINVAINRSERLKGKAEMDDVIRRSVLRRAVSQQDISWTEETSLPTAFRSHARLPFDDLVRLANGGHFVENEWISDVN